MNSSDPLPAWREGASKTAILDFVESVSEPGDSHVSPEERIAVFDADGTLWCEQPVPVEADFILRRLAEMAKADPTLRDRQPWKAAYERDNAWLGKVITKHYDGNDTKAQTLLGGVAAAFAGIGVEDFEAESDSFLRNTQHNTRLSVVGISTPRMRRWSSCSPTWRRTGSRTTSFPGAALTSCARSRRRCSASRLSA